MSKTITIIKGCSEAKVTLINKDGLNPHKILLGHKQWEESSPEDRFLGVRHVIKKQLPSLNDLQLEYRVQGLPRNQFAQHCRARIGVSFSYRDPQEKPSRYIPYTPVFEKLIKEEEEVLSSFELESSLDKLSKLGKNFCHQIRAIPEGDWSVLRDYLPLCYEEDYSFKITFQALMGQCSRRLCLGEEAFIVANHYLQKHALAEVSPMLASLLRAACTRVGKCLYSKSYTLSNAFGCLFSGCNYRNPSRTDYASFNQSCSDINTLRQELTREGEDIVTAMDNLDHEYPCRYEDLYPQDRALFEQD